MLEWRYHLMIFNDTAGLPLSTSTTIPASNIEVAGPAGETHLITSRSRLKSAAIVRLSEHEQKRLARTHYIVSVIGLFTGLFGLMGEWYRYPELSGDFLLVGYSLSAPRGILILRTLQNLFESAERIKASKQMQLTEIVRGASGPRKWIFCAEFHDTKRGSIRLWYRKKQSI